MTIIFSRFDEINSCHIDAYHPTDSVVNKFANERWPEGHTLREVWVVQPEQTILPESYLSKLCYNSLEELAGRYSDKEIQGMYNNGLRAKLLSHFSPGLTFNETVFHVSVEETIAGPVISIVFGTWDEIIQLYKNGLRVCFGQNGYDETSD